MPTLMPGKRAKQQTADARFPGIRAALDGNSAVIMCEREATDAAGAYPITPSTQMGEYWAENAAAGHVNISGRPLIFVEPEGEHAAAAVTAGMSMTGLRAANFSSGQGIAYMHESLYAAVGKRLTYVLNIGARAMTKSTLNVHAGHDDYHCIDDTGFFQLFAKDAQSAADLNLIAHRIAELSLTPGAIAQDGFLTTHLIESIRVPERELIAAYLGRPDDIIETPTAAQRMIYGDQRRRIPILWDVDNPIMAGLVQNQDAYMQSVASQRPFFFDHIQALADQAFCEFAELTGRDYRRVRGYRLDDAEYLIVGQGSLIPSAEAVADYLREKRGIKLGVVDLVMFRPFPGDLLSRVLKGRKGVAVLERIDQPLAADLPLMREIRATLNKCLENGRTPKQAPYPELETYRDTRDLPALYSGSFGMGSRDLQPEGIIGAVENMLADGPQKRFFYLSIDFLRDEAANPKQQLHQEAIASGYPDVKGLAVRGSENPNLMPKDSITVRFHSVGGWGAITTGKNLAMTLYELLGYEVKANPKYGSEKKGQPTTYYLSAAPEAIRINCEYFYVDVVLSPDPNVFEHTNAIAGLKDGGTFVMQSEATTPAEFWEHIPATYRQMIRDKNIRVFYLDAFKIARDEATDPDLQLRMQGNAFQGAFFAASPVMKQVGLTDVKLLAAIREQLDHKFGSKGQRIVEDNMRVVQRGFDEIHAAPYEDMPAAKTNGHGGGPGIPLMVLPLPVSQAPISDIHRFWEQTGNYYMSGRGNDNLADPFIALGTMPASSALFRDMTQIRFHHPEFIAENCTGCGSCYTVCPDTAIPGLVVEFQSVFDTVIERLRKHGQSVEHLPRATRVLAGELRQLCNQGPETASVRALLETAIETTLEKTGDDTRDALAAEFDAFRRELGDTQFALTRPYYTNPEQDQAGDGALLAITVNPYTCKGCMECIEVCNDDALVVKPQTPESIQSLRDQWDLWLDLPDTPDRYLRYDDLNEGGGALETLLLKKQNYLSFTSGDGACLGCAEKTVMHLFTGTVEALMRPRVAQQVARIEQLMTDLQKHIQLKLAEELQVDGSLVEALGDTADTDLTLATLAQRIEQSGRGQVIDQEWLRRVGTIMARLADLRQRYLAGENGRGRAAMGMINATGCTSVWGSTYPFNPYPFPWTNHLFQDSPSVAMGIFEGHMAKMADGFKAIRSAELELQGQYNPAIHDEFFTHFGWEQFTDDEWRLCPPVVSVGGDGAMYDIGFQNLSRLMASGKPIKVLVLDTQVYSNTGGQACTSGFFGQVSDMAQFGKAIRGKEEPRKEIGLVGMAHRTTYILQSTIAHAGHMIEGFVEGLNARRPALFNLYTSCQPEHGIGDDMATRQARLAVESRAYPLFRYDPDAGDTPAECFDLSGNPAMDDEWPSYTLAHEDDGKSGELTLQMTFADFAATEVRFRKHFRAAPPDTWNDNMVPVAEYLELDPDDRADLVPFVWTLDKKNHLSRLVVADAIIRSCEDRRHFWRMLKSLAGLDRESRGDIEAAVRQEVVGSIASGLMQLAGGGGGLPAALPGIVAGKAPAPGGEPASGGAEGEYMAPWIDTPACTSCDECVHLNGKMFKYNDQKKAVIADPNGGPYSDLVKAAERCTARVIHPGLPRDRSEKGIDKWIKRGSKFN